MKITKITSVEDWCRITFETAYSNPMSVAKEVYFKKNEDKYEEVTEIRIPKTITALKEYQFFNLKSLASVILETGWIKSVGGQCFKNCKNLEMISIEADKSWKRGLVELTKIGKSAFESCSSLKSIEFRHRSYEFFDPKDYYFSIAEKV